MPSRSEKLFMAINSCQLFALLRAHDDGQDTTTMHDNLWHV